MLQVLMLIYSLIPLSFSCALSVKLFLGLRATRMPGKDLKDKMPFIKKFCSEIHGLFYAALFMLIFADFLNGLINESFWIEIIVVVLGFVACIWMRDKLNLIVGSDSNYIPKSNPLRMLFVFSIFFVLWSLYYFSSSFYFLLHG